MKKISVIIFCFFFTLSNAQDFYDKMAKETCECVQSKKLDFQKVSYEEIQASLGACMIPSFVKYKDKLEKENQVEFSDKVGMRKLGELIGTKMVIHCPDLMLKIGTEYLKKEESGTAGNEEKNEKTTIVEDTALEGTYIETKSGDFLTIVLKEKSGRFHQLLFLNFFENAELITNGKLKPNQKIAITYNEHEFYDPKLKDYKYYKVLYSLKIL